jgi:hypothetical protein
VVLEKTLWTLPLDSSQYNPYSRARIAPEELPPPPVLKKGPPGWKKIKK